MFGNTLYDNNIGIYFVGYSPSYNNTIIFNNIYNNTSNKYIYNNQKVIVTAENNYWGTVDCLEINEKIHDYYDDNSLGIVYYTYILDAKYPSGISILCPCIDNDGDGFNRSQAGCGVADCNDTQGSIYPGILEYLVQHCPGLEIFRKQVIESGRHLVGHVPVDRPDLIGRHIVFARGGVKKPAP